MSNTSFTTLRHIRNSPNFHLWTTVAAVSILVIVVAIASLAIFFFARHNSAQKNKQSSQTLPTPSSPDAKKTPSKHSTPSPKSEITNKKHNSNPSSNTDPSKSSGPYAHSREAKLASNAVIAPNLPSDNNGLGDATPTSREADPSQLPGYVYETPESTTPPYVDQSQASSNEGYYDLTSGKQYTKSPHGTTQPELNRTNPESKAQGREQNRQFGQSSTLTPGDIKHSAASPKPEGVKGHLQQNPGLGRADFKNHISIPGRTQKSNDEILRNLAHEGLIDPQAMSNLLSSDNNGLGDANSPSKKSLAKSTPGYGNIWEASSEKSYSKQSTKEASWIRGTSLATNPSSAEMPMVSGYTHDAQNKKLRQSASKPGENTSTQEHEKREELSGVPAFNFELQKHDYLIIPENLEVENFKILDRLSTHNGLVFKEDNLSEIKIISHCDPLIHGCIKLVMHLNNLNSIEAVKELIKCDQVNVAIVNRHSISKFNNYINTPFAKVAIVSNNTARLELVHKDPAYSSGGIPPRNFSLALAISAKPTLPYDTKIGDLIGTHHATYEALNELSQEHIKEISKLFGKCIVENLVQPLFNTGISRSRMNLEHFADFCSFWDMLCQDMGIEKLGMKITGELENDICEMDKLWKKCLDSVFRYPHGGGIDSYDARLLALKFLNSELYEVMLNFVTQRFTECFRKTVQELAPKTDKEAVHVGQSGVSKYEAEARGNQTPYIDQSQASSHEGYYDPTSGKKYTKSPHGTTQPELNITNPELASQGHEQHRLFGQSSTLTPVGITEQKNKKLSQASLIPSSLDAEKTHSQHSAPSPKPEGIRGHLQQNSGLGRAAFKNYIPISGSTQKSNDEILRNLASNGLIDLKAMSNLLSSAPSPKPEGIRGHLQQNSGLGRAAFKNYIPISGSTQKSNDEILRNLASNGLIDLKAMSNLLSSDNNGLGDATPPSKLPSQGKSYSEKQTKKESRKIEKHSSANLTSKKSLPASPSKGERYVLPESLTSSAPSSDKQSVGYSLLMDQYEDTESQIDGDKDTKFQIINDLGGTMIHGLNQLPKGITKNLNPETCHIQILEDLMNLITELRNPEDIASLKQLIRCKQAKVAVFNDNSNNLKLAIALPAERTGRIKKLLKEVPWDYAKIHEIFKKEEHALECYGLIAETIAPHMLTCLLHKIVMDMNEIALHSDDPAEDYCNLFKKMLPLRINASSSQLEKHVFESSSQQIEQLFNKKSKAELDLINKETILFNEKFSSSNIKEQDFPIITDLLFSSGIMQIFAGYLELSALSAISITFGNPPETDFPAHDHTCITQPTLENPVDLNTGREA